MKTLKELTDILDAIYPCDGVIYKLDENMQWINDFCEQAYGKVYEDITDTQKGYVSDYITYCCNNPDGEEGYEDWLIYEGYPTDDLID